MTIGTIAFYLLASRQPDPALQATDFAAVPVAVHSAAPEISLSDLQGNEHALADYRGQVVVVNLWATWCPPCEAEMPLLEKYFEQHRQEGFTVIGIEDGESAGEVRKFVQRLGLTFPVLLDPHHEATTRAFKTMNLPTSYVIDRSGMVRFTWLGAISTDNLEKYVTPIIRER